MAESSARVATDRASRYIKQLVSHMGNRVATKLAEDGTGTIELAAGKCVLAPAADHIDLTATADDADALLGVQDVIARHLVRFGTKDELTVEWRT